MKSIYLILVLLCLFLSCTNRTDESKSKRYYDKSFTENKDSILSKLKSKEFVYIDNDSVVHLDLKCGIPILCIDNEFQKIHCVKRMPTNCLTQHQLDRCCAVCINDNEYKYLKNLTDSIYEDKLNSNNAFSKYGGKIIK
jgi:hypothetical protein